LCYLDMDQQQQEFSFCYHREMLALNLWADQYISWDPVCNFKNFQTCENCCIATMFISKPMKIIIMDSSYFHFLKDIQQLCGEFLQIAIQRCFFPGFSSASWSTLKLLWHKHLWRHHGELSVTFQHLWGSKNLALFLLGGWWASAQCDFNGASWFQCFHAYVVTVSCILLSFHSAAHLEITFVCWWLNLEVLMEQTEPSKRLCKHSWRCKQCRRR
jgi:hypothetical protein